ncbi:glycoside hydrolase 15-related protein, partial [mine drainage metagenome]
RCLRGRVAAELVFAPRFDYGRTVPEMVETAHGVLARSPSGSIALSFLPGGRAELRRGEYRLRFSLDRGEQRSFVISPGAEVVTPIGAFRSDLRRQQTIEYWRTWSSRSPYRGRWQAEIQRSALALKLLFYRPTGAMVAAATTSLPEEIGGARNWDYRFTWVRDTA